MNWGRAVTLVIATTCLGCSAYFTARSYDWAIHAKNWAEQTAGWSGAAAGWAVTGRKHAVTAAGCAEAARDAAEAALDSEGRANDYADASGLHASVAEDAACASTCMADQTAALYELWLSQATTKFHGPPASVTHPVMRIFVDLKMADGTWKARYVGSGVAVGPHTILSAGHLWPKLDPASFRLRAQTAVGEQIVKLKAVDYDIDLAIFTVEKPLPVIATLNLTSDVDINAPLFVVGCPGGAFPNVTLGFLSNKGTDEYWEGPHYWQTSNVIYGGNSGGGVYSAETGKLIGILVAGNSAPNFALFVPFAFAAPWVEAHL